MKITNMHQNGYCPPLFSAQASNMSQANFTSMKNELTVVIDDGCTSEGYWRANSFIVAHLFFFQKIGKKLHRGKINILCQLTSESITVAIDFHLLFVTQSKHAASKNLDRPGPCKCNLPLIDSQLVGPCPLGRLFIRSGPNFHGRILLFGFTCSPNYQHLGLPLRSVGHFVHFRLPVKILLPRRAVCTLLFSREFLLSSNLSSNGLFTGNCEQFCERRFGLHWSLFNLL